MCNRAIVNVINYTCGDLLLQKIKNTIVQTLHLNSQGVDRVSEKGKSINAEMISCASRFEIKLLWFDKTFKIPIRGTKLLELYIIVFRWNKFNPIKM